MEEFKMSIEKVKEILSKQLEISVDEIQIENSLQEDLGADSLDVVELVMALEEKFDIEIPDEEAEKILTVGDAIAYIENNKQFYTLLNERISLSFIIFAIEFLRLKIE